METKYTYDDKGRIILEIDIDDKNTLIKETRYKYEENNGYKYVYKRIISKYNINDSYFQIYKYDNYNELVSCMIKDVYNRKIYEFKDSNILINDYNNNTVTTAVLSNDKILKLTKYKIADNKQYILITFTSEKNGVFKLIEYDIFNRIKSIHIFHDYNYLIAINKSILQNPINHINNIFSLTIDSDLNDYDFTKISYTYEKNTNKIKRKTIFSSTNYYKTVFEYNDGTITSFKAKGVHNVVICTIDININNTNSIYEINRLECDISIIEQYHLYISHNLHLVYENDILVEVYDNNVKNKNEYNNKLNTLFTKPEIKHFSDIINLLEHCDNIIKTNADMVYSFTYKEYNTFNKAENDYISFTKDNYTLKSSGNVLTICKTSIDNDIKTIEVFKVLFDIRKFNKDSSIESYIKKLKEEDILSKYILKYKLLPNNKEILINREEIKK